MATRKHVLVMSYPAFGHYIPMLSVAERIIPHHDVTFVVSASKANDIRKRGLLPPAPIRFHTFDDELTINLDENFSQLRTLMDIMYDQAPRYARFIGSLNRAGSPLPHVDAVFCDIFNHAPCQPCRDNGIPLYIVSVLPAMLIAGGTRVTKDTPTVSDDTFFSSAAAGEEKDMTNPPMQESSKIINLDGIEAIKCCKAILFNSFEDLEPGAIQTLHDIPCMKGKILKFIGPLMPTNDNLDGSTGLAGKVMKWMEKQKECSVIYFSFGSIAVVSQEQLIEIGNALVSLKRPFVWALRPLQQVHLPENFKRSTEENFSMDSDYLVIPWAPQKALLSHPANAVFVSHCGWNSTVEAVCYGVPIVAWPMFGDQHFNAALLERLGTSVTIPGTGMRDVRLVPAGEIAGAVERVGEFNGTVKSGPQFRENSMKLAGKAAEVISPTGSSIQNLMSILNSL